MGRGGKTSACWQSGAAHAFFVPLLGALALGLVEHGGLNRTMGANQGWNHAGNLAAGGAVTVKKEGTILNVTRTVQS